MTTPRSDILSVAPMIQWTDRHWRFFFRGITSHTLLYSEMLMDKAIFYNAHQLDNFLGHDLCEEPLAIQLGGSDPSKLAEAAYLVQQYRPPGSSGFQEINLNAGCPSNKAKRQGYGAELMLEPDRIGELLSSMSRRATCSDISIKCRIGVNPGPHSFDDLTHFIRQVESSGVRKVILHARLCELYGLSPAQNRTVPPLHPELVHRLVTLFPTMRFILNGGIQSLEEAAQHVDLAQYNMANQYITGSKRKKRQFAVSIEERDQETEKIPATEFLSEEDIKEEEADMKLFTPSVHGVMIGRAIYHHPFNFSEADTMFYGASSNPMYSRQEALMRYLDYADDAFNSVHVTDTKELEAIPEDRNVHSATVSSSCVVQYTCCDSVVEGSTERGCMAENADSAFNSSSNISNGNLSEQVKKTYGKRCCQITRPLHNFFHGIPQNWLFKQKFDQQVLTYSKLVDQGKMQFSEMILPVVEEVIGAEYLQARGML